MLHIVNFPKHYRQLVFRTSFKDLQNCDCCKVGDNHTRELANFQKGSVELAPFKILQGSWEGRGEVSLAAGAEFHTNRDCLGGIFVCGGLGEVWARVRMGKNRILVVSSGLWDFCIWTCIGVPRHVLRSRAHWMSCAAIGSDSGLCQLLRTQSRWVNYSYSPKHSYVTYCFFPLTNLEEKLYTSVFLHIV